MARKPSDKPPTGKPVDVAPGQFETALDQRRIRDVSAARSIYNKLVQDDTLRSSTIAQTRNQLEGGRPFDPKLLEEQGAAWQTNVNFGDAQAARNRTLLPYWKMVNEVPRKIAVTIPSNSPKSDQWQVAFAEAYDEFIEDWGADYWVQFMNFCSNFVNFGPGIVQWDNPDEARFSNMNVQRVYWPKNARMSPAAWDVVCVTRDVSPSELYLKVKDEASRKRSAYAGWNLKAVEAAIVQGMYGTSTRDARDYTRAQDDLVNNDITVSSTFQPLQLVWLFVRQFSGKIGCYVFTVQGGLTEFMFEAEDYARDFRHLIGAVWYDTGTDSMVHSIKGFGIKNYFFSVLQNRMKSRIMDSATMGLGLNFTRDNNNIPDESPPVESYGAVNVFPSGLTQIPIYPQLQQAQGVIELLERNASDNNALYREQQQQIGDTDTATQAKLLAAMSGELSEASAAIFLAQYGENIQSEQVRRLRMKGNKNEDAKKFVQRLKQRGVPDEVIYDHEIRVKAGASAGLANPALRTMAFQEGMQIARLPGVNGRWFLENWIANKFGSHAVSKALLPEGVNSNPAQRREAIMENTSFGQGVPLPVDPSDAHFEHLEEHLKPLEQIAGQYRSTNDVTPEQLALLTIGIEHSAEHMAYLSKDETAKVQYQQVWPVFSNIQSITRGILSRVAKQQRGIPQQT